MKVFRSIEMRPSRPRVGLRIGLAALLAVLSVLLTVDAVERYEAQAKQEERWRDNAFKHRMAVHQFAQQQALRDQLLRQLDEMSKPWLETVAFPWDDLLVSVERLKEPGIRPMSLAVDAQRGTARLVLECRDSEQAAELSQMLDDGRPRDQRRWQLLRTRMVGGSSPRVESELQFSVNRAE
jgi:hypothetical protein